MTNPRLVPEPLSYVGPLTESEAKDVADEILDSSRLRDKIAAYLVTGDWRDFLYDIQGMAEDVLEKRPTVDEDDVAAGGDM